MRTLHCLLVILVLCFQALSAQWSLVKVREAKIYSSTGPDAVILDVLAAGMMVDVLKTEGKWARISLPGTAEMGWVELSALRAAKGTRAAAAKAGDAVSLTSGELNETRERNSRVRESLSRVEGRMNALLDLMEKYGLHEPEPIYPFDAEQEVWTPVMAQPQVVKPAPEEIVLKPYHWSNRFIAGKFFRGGEDIFGLGFSRVLNSPAWAELDLELCYGLGDNAGKSDDFISWNLGLRCNLQPEKFRIYPYLVIYGGMRHYIESLAGLRSAQMVQLSPGVGVAAELSSMFALALETRAVFLFDNGDNLSEGRVGFSCRYLW